MASKRRKRKLEIDARHWWLPGQMQFDMLLKRMRRGMLLVDSQCLPLHCYLEMLDACPEIPEDIGDVMNALQREKWVRIVQVEGHDEHCIDRFAVLLLPRYVAAIAAQLAIRN